MKNSPLWFLIGYHYGKPILTLVAIMGLILFLIALIVGIIAYFPK